MADVKIKDLEKVLRLKNGQKLVSYETKLLTKPGENYGSLMLAIDVEVRNEDGKKEVLNLVGKMCPQSDFLQQIFNTSITFKKEIGLYMDIVPALERLQVSEGVKKLHDIFPKCYGARISANKFSPDVDSDAILILENVKPKNYVIGDSMAGFDKATTELILKNLATFHALPIALKIKQPEVFINKVLPHLSSLDVFSNMGEQVIAKSNTVLLDMLSSMDEIKQHIEKLKEVLFTKPDFNAVEPYATLLHNDFWVNNTMLLHDENKNPIHNLLVDFQLITYGSPAHDIVFFLFSSVNTEVLKQYYEYFVKLYHNSFIEALQELNCDTSVFTYDLLCTEIDRCAITTQITHCMYMLRPLYTDRSKASELDKVSEHDFTDNSKLSPLYQQRTKEAVLAFAERKWL